MAGLLIPTRFDLNAARRDLEALKATGKKTGKEAGDLLVTNLKAAMQRKTGEAREALTRGLISKDEFRKIGVAAGKEFNAGIHDALKQLRREGRENTEEFGRLQRALRTVGTEATKAGRDGARSFDLMGKASNTFRNALGGIAAFFTVRAIGRFFGASIKEAEEASRVWTNLQGAIENAGVAFDRVRPRIEAAAEATQKTTRFSDEQYADALANVVSITNDYTRSIESMDVVLDLAARKKLDLATASTLVGKALAGETGTLARYGIVVREGADAVQLMRERFRGAAEQDGASLSGRLAQLRNQWAEVKEAVGEAVVANDAASGSVAGLVGVLQNMEEWIKRNEHAISSLVRAVAGAGRIIGNFIADVSALLDPVGASAGAQIASIRTGIDMSSARQIEARMEVERRNIADQARRRAELEEREKRLDSGLAKMSPVAGFRLDGVRAELEALRIEGEATARVMAELTRAHEAATKAGEPTGDPPPKPRPQTDEEIARAKKAAEERLRIESELTDRLFSLTATATEEAIAQLDALVEAYRRAGGDVADILPQVTTLKADLQLGADIERAQEEFAKLGKAAATPETLAALTAVRDRVIAWRDAVGETHDRYKDLDAMVQQVNDRIETVEVDAAFAPAREAFAQAMADLREQAARGVIDQDEFKARARQAGATLKAEILRVIEELRKAGKLTVEVQTRLVEAAEQAGNAGGGGDPAEEERRRQEERIRNLREQARTLEENARAGIQVAEAMGLIDEEAARTLQTVVQLASAIGRIAAGDLTAIPSALGSVASLLGKSSSARERDALLERNTQALRDLAAELAGFRLTGEVIQNASRAITGALEKVPDFKGQQRDIEAKHLEEQIRKLGLSMEDLDRVAKDLGIEIRDKSGRLVREGLEQLAEQLALKAKELVGFRFTPDQQRQAAELEADIFDQVADSNAKLAREIALLAKFAPKMAAALEGIDTSTPAGRAEAEKLVRDLFLQFQAGTLDLEKLTRDEFLEFIQNIEGALDDTGTESGDTQEGFQVVRTITEVTANRMVGTLTTIAALEREVVENTEKLVALLQGGAQATSGDVAVQETGENTSAVAGPAAALLEPPDVPVIEAPALVVPPIDVPALTAEPVAVPPLSVDVPPIEAPAVRALSLEVPALEAPAVEVPPVPVLEAPAIDVPRIEVPALEAPAVDVPAIAPVVVAFDPAALRELADELERVEERAVTIAEALRPEGAGEEWQALLEETRARVEALTARVREQRGIVTEALAVPPLEIAPAPTVPPAEPARVEVDVPAVPPVEVTPVRVDVPTLDVPAIEVPPIPVEAVEPVRVDIVAPDPVRVEPVPPVEVAAPEVAPLRVEVPDVPPVDVAPVRVEDVPALEAPSIEVPPLRAAVEVPDIEAPTAEAPDIAPVRVEVSEDLAGFAPEAKTPPAAQERAGPRRTEKPAVEPQEAPRREPVAAAPAPRAEAKPAAPPPASRAEEPPAAPRATPKPEPALADLTAAARDIARVLGRIEGQLSGVSPVIRPEAKPPEVDVTVPRPEVVTLPEVERTIERIGDVPERGTAVPEPETVDAADTLPPVEKPAEREGTPRPHREREVLTERIAASLATLADIERRGVEHTARLVRLMTAVPQGKAPAPPVPAPQTITQPVTIDGRINIAEGAIGPFTIEAATEQEAEKIGRAAGRGFTEEVKKMDRALGDRSLDYRRARGLR